MIQPITEKHPPDVVCAPPFERLPQEMIFLIFSFLQPTDVARMCQLNRRFRHLASDKNLWKRIFEKELPHIKISQEADFQCAFARYYHIDRNLQQGTRSMKHTHWLQQRPRCFSVGKFALYLGYEYGKFEKRSKADGNPMQTYRLGDRQIQCIEEMDEDRLAIATHTHVALWNISHPPYRIFGFKDPIQRANQLSIHDHRLLAGTKEGNIHLLDLDTGLSLATLTDDPGACDIFHLQHQTLFTAGLKNAIHLWDLRTQEKEESLFAHKGLVLSLKGEDHQLLSTSLDNTAVIWDMRMRRPLYCFDQHRSWVMDGEFAGERVISSGSDHKGFIWKRDDPTCFHEFYEGKMTLSNVHYEEGVLWATTEQGYLAQWDFLDSKSVESRMNKEIP